MQASLLASVALTAEVATLKHDLQGSKEELGLMKKHLEDSQGMKWPVRIFRKDECFVLIKVS